MSVYFRLAMDPPTVTAQEHKVMVRNGKPVFYDPQELKEAKASICARLAKYAPQEPITDPVVLEVKWLFQIRGGSHTHGQWRKEKPDTDNLQKMLKDCMTLFGFWKDDALVVRETVEKRWVEHHPGIYVSIMTTDEYEKLEEALWDV